MKTIFSAVFSLLALSVTAHASDVTAINCLASNGVSITGESKGGAPFTVTSTWGYFTKDFTVGLVDMSASDKINVDLVAKDGPSYVLALAKTEGFHYFDKAPATEEVYGTILQLSEDKTAAPLVVAYVRCDLRIR